MLSDSQPPHPSLEFCIWEDLTNTAMKLFVVVIFLGSLLSGQRSGPSFSELSVSIIYVHNGLWSPVAEQTEDLGFTNNRWREELEGKSLQSSGRGFWDIACMHSKARSPFSCCLRLALILWYDKAHFSLFPPEVPLLLTPYEDQPGESSRVCLWSRDLEQILET